MTTAPTASGLQIRELPHGAPLGPFIDLAWKVNGADPNWVPPLRMALETVMDRRKHPFHHHAEVAYFVAERRGKVVGRIAAIVNRLHNDFHRDRTGFFGLFECEDEVATARALVERASAWLRERGMTQIRGPMNLSTNEEASSPGVLIEGFDTPPMVQMSHNPPYYGALLEGAGLTKAKDLLAFWMDQLSTPERVVRGAERILQRHEVVIRPMNMKRFRQEVDILKDIYNSAWSANWGFVPMTDAEFEHMAKEFRPVVDPDLVLIGELRGEPVGFAITMPDLNQALRHLRNGRLLPFGIFRFLWHRRKIRRVRVITLGIKREYQHLGLGPAFYLHNWRTSVGKGYTEGEASWILEDNHEMVRAMEQRMGCKPYKRYRIYEGPIAG